MTVARTMGGRPGDGKKSSLNWGVLALPAKVRKAARAVYTFCHAVDDDIDRDSAGAAERVAGWRTEVDSLYRHGHPRHSVVRALAPHVLAHSLPREHFDRILDGAAMDADRRKFADMDALAVYCECVAGAPGLLILKLLDLADNPRARSYAVNLAIGLKLVNIIRDLGADLARGRIYVPAEDFAGAGYTEKELADRTINDGFFTLCRFEAARARSFLGRAEKDAVTGGLRRALAGPEIMRAINEELLRRMEKTYDDALFSGFPPLSAVTKIVIAASTWVEVRLGG